MRSLSNILKASHYLETDLRAMGVKVLRSSLRQAAEASMFETPPGLTLEEWRDRVAQIEAEALEKASAITKRAEAQAQETMAFAREAGYREGYSKGYEEGYAKGELEAKTHYQREWDTRLEQLATVLDEILRFRSILVDRYKSDIVQLVIEMAQMVTCAQIDKDDTTVLRVIEACLRKASSPTTLTIRVNLSDLPVVVDAKRDLEAKYPTLESIEVVDDPSVERGGCLIETDSGFLDGRIGQQFQRVAEAFNDSVQEG
jgi:flagellar assembly protein FliH